MSVCPRAVEYGCGDFLAAFRGSNNTDHLSRRTPVLMSVLQRCCSHWYSLRRDRCARCGALLADKKKKTYAVDFYRGGRRERIVTGSNKSDALRYNERMRVRVREQKLDQSPHPISFKQLVKMYLERAKGTRSEPTTKTIVKFFLKEWGNLRTNQITPALIEALRTKMRLEGKSKRWIDYHMAVIRSAYNLAHLPNPFQKIRQFNEDTRVIRYLSVEERKALMVEMARSPIYLQEMLLVSLETGLRQGDVYRLRRDEVDFEREIILLRVSTRTKGRKPHAVPMSRLCCQVLKDIPENGTAYFWVNPKTAKPYRDIKKSWATLKRRAGITRTFRWHDLRHDFLSRVVTVTGSLRIAQEIAGHSDPRITDRYAHLITEGLQNAIQQVSDFQVTTPSDDTENPLK